MSGSGQNFVYDQCKGIEAVRLAADLREAPKYVSIPDYAYDCHTAAGRKKGRTKAQFFRDEQRALRPHQPGYLTIWWTGCDATIPPPLAAKLKGKSG